MPSLSRQWRLLGGLLEGFIWISCQRLALLCSLSSWKLRPPESLHWLETLGINLIFTWFYQTSNEFLSHPVSPARILPELKRSLGFVKEAIYFANSMSQVVEIGYVSSIQIQNKMTPPGDHSIRIFCRWILLLLSNFKPLPTTVIEVLHSPKYVLYMAEKRVKPIKWAVLGENASPLISDNLTAI